MSKRHRHHYQRLSDTAIFCACGEVKRVALDLPATTPNITIYPVPSPSPYVPNWPPVSPFVWEPNTTTPSFDVSTITVWNATVWNAS